MRGAIAIGSNSTRLLTAEKKDGRLLNAERGRAETKLFLGLDENGFIRPERLEETAQAVCLLARAAKDRGAESLILMGTSAIRDAKNGDVLAKRIEALCGLSLHVISGEEEARLAFLAAAGRERRLVIDIGGGSTEWTLGEKGQVEWAKSAQMGASRLLTQCPITSLEDGKRAFEMAKAVLTPLADALKTFASAPVMIGLGGTCTTAAAIQMGKEAHGPMVEGQNVSLEAVKGQWELLCSLPLAERMKVPGLPPARAIHMPHGLSILLAVMTLGGFDRLSISGRNNLDGYLLSLPDEA